MSVSINSNYSNLYGNWTTANLTSIPSTQQTSSNSESTFKDYMQLATSTQFTSSGNYSSSTTDLTSLTTEQKTAYLETMLKRLESTDSSESSYLPESLQTALSTVGELLSDFQASDSSEEEISELFTAVTETPEEAKPSKAEMTPPPLPINNITAQMDDSSSETSTELSVDQMKELIFNLINTLSENDSTDNTDTLSASITEQLSDYDQTTATDEEIQTLFENLMKQVETSQQNITTGTNDASGSTDAFPSSIQMTGTSLPPFNWKPI
ncbi:hypothetical protein [Bacillus sp. 522_BSPC]|uniref:hypothetical protein n=1 Tax=Bacillus sp. 522_BSPC TaxID=1579338 RepID=UPI000660E2C3|nr:hypothetical protein [Bacillus sp. 522_BSPC]